MFNNLQNSLLNLEKSFKTGSAEVKKVSNIVENDLNLLKDELNNDDAKNSDFKKLLPLIEKLSIQNDYKLSMIKDFPKYILNKK